MTSHGFGGLEIESSKISPQQKAKFAEEVSKVKHVVKAHAVKTGRYDIIFEFEHLKPHGKKPADLLPEIQEKISAGGHQIASAHFYVIESSYRRGKKLIEPKERKI